MEKASRIEAAASLEELVHHFQTRLEKTNKVIRLIHLNQDVKAKRVLEKMTANVTMIEGMLYEIRMLAGKKKKNLEELRVLQGEMVEVNRQMSHQLTNLPQHLPAQKSHTQKSEATPLRERQLSGGKQSTNSHSKNGAGGIPTISYITVEEFESVPKYIRGRQSYEKVNGGIAELNKTFFSKYKILKFPKSTMNDKTRYKYNLYKEQESNQTKGEYFCVEEDIKANSSLKMDNHGRALMTVLRHLQRIKEIRGNNLVRYAVVQ